MSDDIRYTPLEKRPIEPTSESGELTAPYGYTKEGTPRKRPARQGEGRPTIYRDDFCEHVIELGKQGKSEAQIARELNVGRADLYDWRERHEEFAAALARARDYAQAYWEDRGHEGLADKGFNAHLWVKTVTARFADYKDKPQITGTIKLQLDKEDVAVC